MFPLSAVVFPGESMPLHVFEPRYRKLVADCLAARADEKSAAEVGGEHAAEFGVVLIRRGSEVGGGDERVTVGTLAGIEVATPLEDGRWVLVARGIRRIVVRAWLAEDPYPIAVVEELTSAPIGDFDKLLARAAREVRRARLLLSEMSDVASLGSDAALPDAPEAAVWQLCERVPVSPYDRQRLLEAGDHRERLEVVIELAESVADDVARLMSGGFY